MLSPEFADFAALGRFSIRKIEDGVKVADDPGGEIRFYIREREPDVFVLSRAERSEDERVIMWSPDPADLERYLTMVVGGSARQWLDRRRLGLPVEVQQIADRFTIEQLEPGVVALRTRQGALLPSRFPRSGVAAPIIRFAQIAALDLAAMREAYLDPEGKPLSHIWTQPLGGTGIQGHQL